MVLFPFLYFKGAHVIGIRTRTLRIRGRVAYPLDHDGIKGTALIITVSDFPFFSLIIFSIKRNNDFFLRYTMATWILRLIFTRDYSVIIFCYSAECMRG